MRRPYEERFVQVVRGTRQLEAPLHPVLTIGNFDGVHLGHRALIDRTRALAVEMSAPAGALTFHPSPQEVLRPESASPRLQTLEQRIARFATTGLDLLVVEPFDRALAALDPQVFAHTFLLDRIGVRGLVLGHDFRFGRGRKGTVEFLTAHLPVPVEQLGAVMQDGSPISSSRIRSALADGDVDHAAQLLGRPHLIEGTVQPGDQRGRTLGYPTANLADVGGLVPANGVYAVLAHAQGAVHPAVANIGTRPTFDGHHRTVEVHILEFQGDLYGTLMGVELVARLRDEQRFDTLDQLVSAIRNDAAQARTLLA